MSLFRKTPVPGTMTATPTPPTQTAAERDATPAPMQSPQPSKVFSGAEVNLPAVYQEARITADELDRVVRAEGLLHLLPSKASQTRGIVDATLRAFSVDRATIVHAAAKQLDALEAFIRSSQEQTQRVLDVGTRRIAELEAEIERIMQAGAQATREGEQRARTVNDEMMKVQRVLDFFGDETALDASDVEVDESQPAPGANAK